MTSIPGIIWSIATKGLPATYRELLPQTSRQSVDWLLRHGVRVDGARVLEVGCGFGSTAGLLGELGADVVAIDIELPRVQNARRDGVQAALADANALQLRDASVDIVLCINVLEHLEDPRVFLREAYRCLKPGAVMYLAWTNWLSPVGGHDFSPFHFLGPRVGYAAARKLRRRERFIQVPYETLYPTYIGPTLRDVRRAGFRVESMTPRYYPRLGLICRVPLAREFLTWNCQLILRKPEA